MGAFKLTPAQRWALQAIADGYGSSPATLGEQMMERPGVAERRSGGNRNSRQGLGRIGGTMMARLSRMGLVTPSSFNSHGWHPTRVRISAPGRAALASPAPKGET